MVLNFLGVEFWLEMAFKNFPRRYSHFTWQSAKWRSKSLAPRYLEAVYSIVEHSNKVTSRSVGPSFFPFWYISIGKIFIDF
jgi:hypothetical protein